MPVKFASEKASITIKVRVTPAQSQAYQRAAHGNVSAFIRHAANECLQRVATKQAIDRTPGKVLGNSAR